MRGRSPGGVFQNPRRKQINVSVGGPPCLPILLYAAQKLSCRNVTQSERACCLIYAVLSCQVRGFSPQSLRDHLARAPGRGLSSGCASGSGGAATPTILPGFAKLWFQLCKPMGKVTPWIAPLDRFRGQTMLLRSYFGQTILPARLLTGLAATKNQALAQSSSGKGMIPTRQNYDSSHTLARLAGMIV